MNELNNFVKKASELIPQGGTWLTLNNLRIFLEIVFNTIYEIIKLGIVLTALHYLYRLTPALEPMLNQLGIK
jgi:hypothetical protein